MLNMNGHDIVKLSTVGISAQI